MNFLNPAAIAIAAGLTVPPLIALYFLKLKRTAKVVPSTLLWKKAVEDLQVNAPFQRLRSSLLLLLQLLVLLLAAIALGKPMFEAVERNEDTVIILVDKSASMSVREAAGQTRLDIAKEQAKRAVDNMSDTARAMVIEFDDRANVVASFDTNKDSLKRKIDSITQSDSLSKLSEAFSLAEAYTQNIIIGGEEAGRDIAPDRPVQPATVFVFTDGRIADADSITLKKFDLSKIHVTNVGKRSDNVGIVAMDARRHFETPAILEVAATVQNFSPDAIAVDAVLYVDGQNVDIQSIELGPAGDESTQENTTGVPNNIGVLTFDDIEFEGGGIVEIMLRIDDALATDDRAWAIIDEPRHVEVLIVSPEDPFIEPALRGYPLTITTMTPAEYEQAPDDVLIKDDRSAFDAVIMDRYTPDQLPLGNYLFMGVVPNIEGVSSGRTIADEIIFNWDDTHPVLRHVSAETLHVDQWLELKLPSGSVSIIDGQSSSVLSYLGREGSQYLFCAFSLVVEDESGFSYRNTDWVATSDFVMFMYNMVQYLASNIANASHRIVKPGDPVTLPIPGDAASITVTRPDSSIDTVPAAGYQSIHYARTRLVGPYRIEPHLPRAAAFAVNLFSAVEGNISPAKSIEFGSGSVETKSGDIKVNRPAWQYFLLGLLVLLLIEWVVYNQRVFV